MFADLEEAMEWGIRRYGSDAFRISYLSVARVERDDEPRDRTTGRMAL